MAFHLTLVSLVSDDYCRSYVTVICIHAKMDYKKKRKLRDSNPSHSYANFDLDIPIVSPHDSLAYWQKACFFKIGFFNLGFTLTWVLTNFKSTNLPLFRRRSFRDETDQKHVIFCTNNPFGKIPPSAVRGLGGRTRKSANWEIRTWVTATTCNEISFTLIRQF